jgi:excisionase family DNA binding protein
MLTPKAAALRLGVSVSLIYAWIGSKLLSHYRAGVKGRGGKILIAEADLMALWESLKVEAAVPAQNRKPPTPKTSSKVKFRHLKF